MYFASKYKTMEKTKLDLSPVVYATILIIVFLLSI